MTSPQTYAFLTQNEGEAEETEEEEEEQDQTEDSEGAIKTMDPREKKVENWMKRLTTDLGVIEIPTVEAGEEEEKPEKTEEDDAGDESSSHEMGSRSDDR